MKHCVLERVAAGLFAVALAGCAWGQEASLPPTIGPYLQNPAPDAMTVCFLAQGTGVVEVLYGAAQPGKPCAVAASAIPGTPWTIWKARIAGLAPGSTHAYRVRLREGDRVTADASAAFTTLDPAAAEARLIALNDLHNQVPVLEALMKQVKPEEFRLSLLLGDCWADPSPALGAAVVFRTLAGYVRLLDAAHKPMLLVRGNHETRGGFSGRLGLLFDIPGLDAAQKPDDQRWPFAFQSGPVSFVAMDTGEDDDASTPTNSYKRPTFWQSYRQRETPWLQAAVSDQAFRAAPWRVFLSHIPLHNPAGWNSEPARTYWEPVLAGAGIDLMLAGHDHQWKLVPAGQPISLTTPPCPLLIGGGPSLKEGAVMVLKATAKDLHVRLLDTAGRLLTEKGMSKGE